MTMPPPYSVVIPAHDEEAVISRCLAALTRDVPAVEMPEIIVVPNGCSDRTAEIARGFAGVVVLELAKGSKTAALNAGSGAATALPRFFLDADIVVDHRALMATAAALAQPGAMAAAPAIRVDVTDCSRLVRAYYRVWCRLPYITDAMVGSGIFGLSEAGLAAVGTFPAIISDDGFVRSRFVAVQRRRVALGPDGAPVCFTMFPPRDVASLVRIEGRRRAGDAELRRLYPTPEARPATTGHALRAEFARQPFAVCAYLAIKTAGRLRFQWTRMLGQQGRWLRDTSSRTA